MSRPICACNKNSVVEMKPMQNGVCVIDKHYDNGSILVRDGDLWGCEVCGTEMIMGFGKQYLSKKERLVNLREHNIRVFDMGEIK